MRLYNSSLLIPLFIIPVVAIIAGIYITPYFEESYGHGFRFVVITMLVILSLYISFFALFLKADDKVILIRKIRRMAMFQISLGVVLLLLLFVV